MLYIIASYRLMQFQENLMDETWKNGKKPSFRPDFGLFGPNLGSQEFFRGFFFCYMLDVIASYHCM